MKSPRFFISVLTALIILSGCAPQDSVSTTNQKKLSVVASFYPLAHFAEQVGGTAVTVDTIVPPGLEPHDFEPTPRDIERIYSADVLILNGAGMESWADKIKGEAVKRGVAVVVMGEHLPVKMLDDELDPHLWLDPTLVQQEVDLIRDAFILKDSGNKTYFTIHAKNYQDQLAALDKEFTTTLATCTLKPVMVSHEAFGYLARRYHLDMIAISGISPEDEPSVRRLAELSTEAREKNIKYIFFETLVPSKLAETIATEIGAKTLVFNPLEGVTEEQRLAGENYLSIMRYNLQNLKVAFECAKS